MKNPTIEDQIQARIEVFAAELSDLVRQAALEAVHDALSGGSTARTAKPGKRKPGRPKGSTNKPKTSKASKPKKRVRRSAEDIEKLSGLIHGFVRKNKGSRLEEISRGLDIPSADMKGPIKEMLAAGKLRKTGQKRGTTYFPKKK